MMEQPLVVEPQDAITKDNITVTISGILYLKVIDAEKATFGVNGYAFAATNLAMTSMRAAIGSMELDGCLQNRDQLNATILNAMSEATAPWGLQVIRYEIKDLNPSSSIMDDMEKQMQAERQKRALILDSEGEKLSAINKAEGEKTSQVLAAEGDKASRLLAAEAERQEQVLAAKGEAEAIKTVAEATAAALAKVGEVASSENGQKAVTFDLSKKAITAQEALSKPSEGNVIMTNGASVDGISETVAKAVSISNAINSSPTT